MGHGHARNEDVYLNKGGANEVSAADIKIGLKREFTADQAIFNGQDSFIITHDSDPDYKRFVQIISKDSANAQRLFNLSTEANYDYNPLELTFNDWQVQTAKAYNVPGMVLNYIFANNLIHDYTEKGNDGTNVNCTFGSGIVDNALVLNGIDSYVDIANVADLRIADPTVKDISFEFWIKSFAVNGEVINLWNESDNRRSWRVYIENYQLKLDVSIDGVTTTATGGIGNLMYENWTHVGIYLDNYFSGTYFKITINGQLGLPGLGMFAYPLFSNTIDTIRIGAKAGPIPPYSGYDSNFLNASLAEFAIYRNRDMTLPVGMQSTQFAADMNTNSMGNHLGSYSLASANIKTNSTGRIDTSSWVSILGIGFQWSSFYNTNLYVLLSVDAGITWKKWDGAAWQTVLETAQGTPVNSFPSDKASWDLLFVAGTLDVLFQLNTNNSTQPAYIQTLSVQYLGSVYTNSEGQIKYFLISPTETEIFND